MLSVDGVVAIRAERLVLAGLHFQVAPGGALLLLGPNGAGKSTLLRILAGLRRPDAGRVAWRGEPIERGGAAYLGHQDGIKPGLTCAENLRLFAPAARVAAAIEAAHLSPLAALPARMLSAGQRRRLALARLDLHAAPVWLLDEPSLGLDDAAVARLGGQMARHRAAGGLVIAATHQALPLPDADTLRLAA